jgi:hypothetical protein
MTKSFLNRAAFGALALALVATTAEQVNASDEDLLFDGTISSAQGADAYNFRQGFPSGDTAADAYRNSLTRRAKAVPAA